MLESVQLKNVGPTPQMELELAPRLNLITGDNGLGKSVLLQANISFEIETGRVAYESPYVPEHHALADGGFAVWDPVRTHWRKNGNRIPAYVLSAKEVWDALRVPVDGRPTQASNGVVADWGSRNVRCDRLGPGQGSFDFAHSQSRAPFVASELRRQGQLARGDA